MAKRLLYNLLVNAIGDYVEGLTEDNLKIGVWSRDVALKNLQINPTIFNKLNIPLNLIFGSIASLELNIPWGSLESSPIKVVVDGIYALVTPIEVSSFDPNEVLKQSKLSKRKRLVNAGKSIEDTLKNMEYGKDTNGASSANTPGYIKRLTTKIIDNIELKVLNVHIRYEDSVSIPGQFISFGVSFESFNLSTTDENWKDAFVKRDTSTSQAKINKLAMLKNITVYWETKAEQLLLASQHPTDILQKQLAMKNCIFTTERAETGISEYLVKVPNAMTVKLVHMENFPNDFPKIDVSIDFSGIEIHVDHLQYSQIIGVITEISAASYENTGKLLRPKASPMDNAKAWWKYAYMRVTNTREMSISNPVI